MRDYKSEIKLLIDSQVNVIELVSFEWQRVHSFLLDISQDMNRLFVTYSPTLGAKIHGISGAELAYQDLDLDSFEDVLRHFYSKSKNVTLLIEDGEQFFNDDNPNNIRLLKEILHDKRCGAKKMNKTLIFTTASRYLPESLSKELPIIEIDYPSKDEIKVIFDKEVIPLKRKHPSAKFFFEDEIADALLGLTTQEIQLAINKVANSEGEISKKQVPLFLKEKCKILKSNNLLELITSDKSLDDVGGLNSLKEWLKSRKQAFSIKAKEFGLPTPKGILLLGVPGCGKSLIAKTIANDWNFPLLKLDFGRLYNRYLGNSELNMRETIQVAEAMAPCILWVDEIEKGLAGAGSDDDGVTSRIFGEFLTWMQEKDKPVFIVATANNLSQIPAELYRKGRFDEIFFVDLPNEIERANIINVHLHTHNNLDTMIDINELVTLSEGFSGAEIESAINDALFYSFDKGIRLLKQKALVKAFKATCPLSRAMPEEINAIRRWGGTSIKSAR